MMLIFNITSIENVEFLQPVEVGDLVSFYASVNYVGKSSLVVGMKVVAENVKMGTARHTNSSYFTMVAKGDDNKTEMVFVSKCLYGLQCTKNSFISPNFMIFQVLPISHFNRYKSFF